MLILCVFCTHAQTVIVKDAGSSEPIPGVVLYNFKKNKSVVTDIDGKADLKIFNDEEIIIFQSFSFKKVQFSKREIAKKNFEVLMVSDVEGLNQVVISKVDLKMGRRLYIKKMVLKKRCTKLLLDRMTKGC